MSLGMGIVVAFGIGNFFSWGFELDMLFLPFAVVAIIWGIVLIIFGIRNVRRGKKKLRG